MTSEVSQIAKTVSLLSCDAVQAANSGHPGLPMGAALFSSLLWSEFLRFNPKDTEWVARDRFILSAGHGSALLYSLLHLFGYQVTVDDLKQFRQWESITPGHPEFGFTPGVEATTGPLGQGASNAVGMALAAQMLASTHGCPLLKYRVFALVSDGDLMEGIASEAASLAGHLQLDNLVYLYDDNKISLAGKTDVCFTENVGDRFAAYGWDVQHVDGHNEVEVRTAIAKAIAASKPAIICMRTTIGFGSPKKAGSCDVHGSPLGSEELAATKKSLGADPTTSFNVPEEVRKSCAAIVEKRSSDYSAWQKDFAVWSKENSDQADKFQKQLDRTLPPALREELLKGIPHAKPDATRNLSGKAIQTIAAHLPQFVGGSADLESSTKTLIQASTEVQQEAFTGRNIRYGVREHAMGAIANGFAYTRAWVPMVSTFLVFSDYLRPVLRLASLSHLQALFVFTHDSFWVGEDGPTHQPIEHVMSLRLIPGLAVYRPADGLEVGAAYLAALERIEGPSALIFTRQNLPPLERSAGANVNDVLRGGYLLSSHGNEQVTLVATGSEVAATQEAARKLAERGLGARVVSMPCVEDFLAQDVSYREKVLPTSSPVIVVEAGRSLGWSDLLGRKVDVCGIDDFGASAPGELLAEKFGFTAAALLERIESIVRR